MLFSCGKWVDGVEVEDWNEVLCGIDDMDCGVCLF